MKCCDINSGMLRRTLVIERRTVAEDGLGGSVDTWATFATLRAQVKPMNGNEQYIAARIGHNAKFKAFVRFAGDTNGNPKYTSEDRVVYQARTYGIAYVTDLEDKRTWIEMGLEDSAR